jgi:hypothetical protein
MKSKFLNLLLVVTSLCGYLEWGGNNHAFLFGAEAEVLVKLFTDPGAIAHPFILLPLAGQFILIITLFQKSPGKTLTYIGMGCLALLLVFMFVIGLLSLNLKIIFSTVPFIAVAIFTIRTLKQDGGGIATKAQRH